MDSSKIDNLIVMINLLFQGLKQLQPDEKKRVIEEFNKALEEFSKN